MLTETRVALGFLANSLTIAGYELVVNLLKQPLLGTQWHCVDTQLMNSHLLIIC